MAQRMQEGTRRAGTPVLEHLRPASVLRRWLPFALTALLLVAGLWMLHRLIAPVGLTALRDHLGTVAPMVWLGAIGATALAYCVFIGFERTALRHLHLAVRPRIAALGAALGYAIGNTVGLSALSGGAARWRVYAGEGLDVWQVGAVSTFTTVAYGIGATVIGLGALACDPTALTSMTAMAPGIVRTASLLVMGLVAGSLLLLSRRTRPLRIGRMFLQPVSAADLGRLLALTFAEMGLAATILHMLLPAGSISWADLVVLYAAATLAGVASHVPGGVGVFEGVIVAALPASVSVAAALTALLMFRLIYLIVPFLIAIAVLPFVGCRNAASPVIPADCRTVIFATGAGEPGSPSRLAWGAGMAARYRRRWKMKVTNTKLGVATLVALGLMGGAAAAQSGNGYDSDDKAEVEALMATKMTLGDAVLAAESSNGGRAMSAEFDNGDDGEMSGFDVELVAADGMVSKVVVDAADGSVKPYVDDGENKNEDNDENESEDGEGDNG